MIEKYSIVSFDLDGTITESRQPIEQTMVNLLCELSKSVTVVIISGSSFKNLLVQLDLLLNIDDKQILKNILLMPTNGSVTYYYNDSNSSWELSDSALMLPDIKNKVIQTLEGVISSGNFDIPNISIGPKVEDRGTQISFAGLGIDAPIEAKKLWDPNKTKRKEIVEFIAPLLPETDIFIAGTTTIDILPKGITKGTMLKKMLEKRELKKEDLLFIGDALFEGGNDYEVKKHGFNTVQTSGPVQTIEIIQSLLNQ
jgi:phosphomannomutase